MNCVVAVVVVLVVVVVVLVVVVVVVVVLVAVVAVLGAAGFVVTFSWFWGFLFFDIFLMRAHYAWHYDLRILFAFRKMVWQEVRVRFITLHKDGKICPSFLFAGAARVTSLLPKIKWTHYSN